jgi:hypothetical protein
MRINPMMDIINSEFLDIVNVGFHRLADDRILKLSDSELKNLSHTLSPKKIRLIRLQALVKNEQERSRNHPKEDPTAPPIEDPLLSSHSFFFAYKPLPVAIESLKKHCYIAAGSGHGKSELIKRLAYGLMKANKSVIVIDPHGKLAREIAQWKEFHQDPDRLIYFAPTLASQTLDIIPIINPISSLYKATNLDEVVEAFIEVMIAVIGEDGELSTRMKTILKPCLYTLSEVENATIYDLFDFLDGYEDEKTKTLNPKTLNPKTLNPKTEKWLNFARSTLSNQSQLDTLNSFFDPFYKTTKSSIRDRLRALLSSNALDRCLAGGHSTIDLENAMNSEKVIVFNLAGLGHETCGAFGRFILGAVQNLAMERQAIEEGERKPVFMFVDEADRFISDAVVQIYRETRKFGLYLGIVQQITGFGITHETFRAITGNSFVRFAGSGGGDAATIKDLSDLSGATTEEIKALSPLHFFVKEGNFESKQFCLLYDKNGETRGAELLGNNNAMTPEQWEDLKRYQIARYYVRKGESEPTCHQKKEPTATSQKKPKNEDPINFYD